MYGIDSRAKMVELPPPPPGGTPVALAAPPHGPPEPAVLAHATPDTALVFGGCPVRPGTPARIAAKPDGSGPAPPALGASVAGCRRLGDPPEPWPWLLTCRLAPALTADELAAWRRLH